jgi:prepilin-type N-terminal cleavage/methylation domain-containing protein
VGTKQIKAFSLIEISVVLLIVAIFIAAISSGKLLLDKSNEIKLQQALQSQLESQEYYSDKSFEVSAADITDPSTGCGANPSDNAIADFLYNQIAKGAGGCCSSNTNVNTLCCDNALVSCTACTVSGTSVKPACLTPDL